MASFFLFHLQYIICASTYQVFLDIFASTHHLSYNENMKTTPAQSRAHQKYQAEKVDVIYVRVPKGRKEVIQEHALSKGLSVNAYVVGLIDKDLKKKQ